MLAKLENRICMQIQDLHAGFGVKEWKNHTGYNFGPTSKIQRECQNCPFGILKLVTEKTSRSYTYTLFLPPWAQNWAYFHPMDAFRRHGQIFKIAYPGMKPGIWKESKLSFWAYFCSTGSGFRDTGWFSKLPYFDMKPGILKKSLFLPMGLKLSLVSL